MKEGLFAELLEMNDIEGVETLKGMELLFVDDLKHIHNLCYRGQNDKGWQRIT